VKKKSEGYALVLTMILLVVLSLLGTAILSIAYGESKMVANQVENKRAYYAARSGADAMASYIIDNSSNSNIATIVSNLITKTSSNPGTGTVGSNTFAVQVSNINSGPYSGDLLIESQGTADAGNLPVTVYLTLKQAVKIALDMAVFADDGMCFGKNITVTGDVGTNSDSITFGKNPINGDVILGPDTSDAEMTIADAMSGNPQKLTSKIIFPDTKATLFPTENNEVFLGTEKKVKGKTVITPYVVTSNPSDQSNKVLATAVTNLSDAMEYIEWPADGGGELQLLITSPDFTLGKTVNVPDGNTLYLYYNGTSQLAESSGNFSYTHISIYAPNAEFNITGGGNGTFLGKMIIGSYDDTSNSHVTLTDDSEIDENKVVGIDTYQRDVWLK